MSVDLPAPFAPSSAMDLAAQHAEVDGAERLPAAEALGEAGDRQDRGCGRSRRDSGLHRAPPALILTGGRTSTSSTTGLRRTPMPSISISQTSPARIQSGGLRAW